MTNEGGGIPRDEIIHLAEKAGWTGSKENVTYVAMLERFAGLVAAAEREACAKVLDDMADEAEREQEPSSYVNYYREKATAIRSRNNVND